MNTIFARIQPDGRVLCGRLDKTGRPRCGGEGPRLITWNQDRYWLDMWRRPLRVDPEIDPPVYVVFEDQAGPTMGTWTNSPGLKAVPPKPTFRCRKCGLVNVIDPTMGAHREAHSL